MKKGLLLSLLMFMMGSLLPVNAQNNGNDSDIVNTTPAEALYGEWFMVGWNDKGTWTKINTSYHHLMSIEIPKEGRVLAYSMANELILGYLTLNGNEMTFKNGGIMTKVGYDSPKNLFFEKYIFNIKTFQLEGNLLRLYYTDEDYFIFTNEPTASDVQNSGCMKETRADSNSTTQSISILKEGNVLTVNLYNYYSQCATEDFVITPSINNGNNGESCSVSVKINSISQAEADCICPYNISFTIHGVESNSFYLDCWWFKEQVNLTEGKTWVRTNEYFPEGTKWTEIRLDTLKYDNWYSKVGDKWVPNFETIEYNVKGTYSIPHWSSPFKCVYTNNQEWTDSLTLLIYEGKEYDMGVMVTVPNMIEEKYTPWPGTQYCYSWEVGSMIEFKSIEKANCTCIFPPNEFDFGRVEEIKEGDFGGVRPLKYTDVNGVRIVEGIGVTTWNDGECLFGPIDPYLAKGLFMYSNFEPRHYRSMLVHFERNGEVLYNVWPTNPEEYVTFTEGQMATIILPTTPDTSMGKYYRLDRYEDGKIIFEEEPTPKARTPYIIIPNKDFYIDPNSLNLKGLDEDVVSKDGISFIGTYSKAEYSYNEEVYISIIDKTPDCRKEDIPISKFTIGSLRAFVKVHWEDPYNPGGTRGVKKIEIILHDEANGIDEIQNSQSENQDDAVYDLAGRRVISKSKIQNSKLPKGIYIIDGKQVLVK